MKAIFLVRMKLFFTMIFCLAMSSMTLALIKPIQGVASTQSQVTGEQIARLSTRLRFDDTRAQKRQVGKQSVVFVPTAVSAEQLENGSIVGRLDTQLKGGRTGLAPGSYHIYLAKSRGEWRAYAESNGRIAAQTSEVTVTSGSLDNSAARIGMPSGPRLEADPQRIKVTIEVECENRLKNCKITVVIVF